VTVLVDGVLDATTYDGQRVSLVEGTHEVRESAQLTFPGGAAVPHATAIEPADNELWSSPLSGSGGRDHPLYATYSLILALFFGTMGLPHVLVRFYTNPDGRAARRTTLVVLCLLGGFYLFPTIYGALARVYTPDLLLTGQTEPRSSRRRRD
jgi:Na+(H+)/acetate symporter ActP